MARRPLRSTALALAATVFVAVAVDRWWPCTALGNGSDACFSRQDDSYTGVGTLFGAVESPLLAVGYALVAVALVMAGSGRRPLAWAAALLPVLQGLATLRVVDGGPWLSVPLVLLTLGVGVLAAASLPATVSGRLRAGYGVGIACTALLVDHVVLSPIVNLGYFSHDTNPWTWLPTGLGCLVAAGALALARTPSVRPSPAPAGTVA